jgi:hypothetical protein
VHPLYAQERFRDHDRNSRSRRRHGTKRCYESAKGLLINEMQDSWFFGSTNPENVRGRFLLFAGGYRFIVRSLPTSPLRDMRALICASAL